jgi:nitrite reductase (NADH) small subunit
MTIIDIAPPTGLADMGRNPWVTVCSSQRLRVNRGLCALVDGQQVAIFRIASGEVFALSNHDPFSGANVISRGIVGSVGDRVTVASPMYKQRFDLRTGACLDDDNQSLLTYAVRDHGGVIDVCVTGVATMLNSR